MISSVAMEFKLQPEQVISGIQVQILRHRFTALQTGQKRLVNAVMVFKLQVLPISYSGGLVSLL